MKVVACCNLCRRGYVAVNPDYLKRDGRCVDVECTGQIEMLAQGVEQSEFPEPTRAERRRFRRQLKEVTT